MPNAIVSREEWLRQRAQLLIEEKAHTKERERLAQRRQQLPWVMLEKTYHFDGPEGEVTLLDLFEGQSQLAIYHLMFGPGWQKPCPGCASWANALNGTTYLFKRADACLIAVSRAPYIQIAEQKTRNGWTFQWVSAERSEFNYDFYASSLDTSAESSKIIGGKSDGEHVTFDRGENHGISVFTKDADNRIYHTYSTYNRGIEAMHGAFGYLDVLPKGRSGI